MNTIAYEPEEHNVMTGWCGGRPRYAPHSLEHRLAWLRAYGWTTYADRCLAEERQRYEERRRRRTR